MNLGRLLQQRCVCRLCGQSSIQNICIFSEEGRRRTLRDLITLHLGIKINENESLSSMVCNNCIKVVEFWNSYRQDCKNTQTLLNESIMNQQNNPTYTELHQYVGVEATSNNTATVELHIPTIIKQEPYELWHQQQQQLKYEQHPDIPGLPTSEEEVVFINMVRCELPVITTTINQPPPPSQELQQQQQIVQNQAPDSTGSPFNLTVEEEQDEQDIKPDINKDARPYGCDTCGKKFMRKCHLQVHLVNHTGEKPYKCQICFRSFSQKSTLFSHSLTHTGIKPFICNICNKSFAQKCNLQTHALVHSGEKPYKCNICNKCFSQKCNLQIHERIHSGEKPYVCQVCGKKFTRSGTLMVHRRVHTKEKPHQCKVCNKRFSQSSNLLNHSLTHSSQRPYQCQTCGQTFNNSGNLSSHLRKHATVAAAQAAANIAVITTQNQNNS